MIDTTQNSRGLYLLDGDAFSRDCFRTSLLSSYFSIFKTIVCCGICLGHPNFQYMKYIFLTCFLKLMFRHCLVMFVFVQTNLRSHFPLNPTNLPNPLPLSISMLRGPIWSLLPQGNVDLLPSSTIIPISLRSFSSLINLRFHRSSNIFTQPSRPSATQKSALHSDNG